MQDKHYYQITLSDWEIAPVQGAYQPVRLNTTRGVIEARYYPVQDARSAVLFVGGAGGGWDSPAHGLYDRLCLSLQSAGIAALRVRYRHANHLIECTLDVLTGFAFLELQGIQQLSAAGHSFGGAVVIGAAANAENTRTVVALSTQSYGINVVSDLPPGCSILFIHGEADRVLPPSCSTYGYSLAHEPKSITLYPEVHHGLDEAAEAIEAQVYTWFLQELTAANANNKHSVNLS